MGYPLSSTETLVPVLEQFTESARHRANFLLGEAYRQAGNCLLALPYYQAYRQEGTHLEDLVAERLAWCYRGMGDHGRAAEEFTLAASPYRSLSDQVWMLEEAARDLRDAGNRDGALARYERILSLARIPWYRASILYQSAELLDLLGRSDEALARWQEILGTYPETVAASWAADILIGQGDPVDPYHVAQSYRAAGRLSESLSWFEQALAAETVSTRAVRYDLAMARVELGDIEGALVELDLLIGEFPDVPELLMEKGRLVGMSGSISRALEVYSLVGERFPGTSEAGEALWRSGRLLEDQRHDDEAIATYTMLVGQHPELERSVEAQFRSGFMRYNQGRYAEAAELWTGTSGLADTRIDYWRGLALGRAGLEDQAFQAWQEAASSEGYYADRARETLSGGNQFGTFSDWPVWGDESEEQAQAEAWLTMYWGRPFTSTLSEKVRSDPFFARGEELLALGQIDEAGRPLAFLIERFRYDGPALYALAHYLRQNQLHALSIRSAHRFLELADLGLGEAPDFLLRLIYPTPYSHLLVLHARANDVDPLLFFSLVRQESLFDRYATSWADARGLTQVIPSTGEWIADYLEVSSFRLQDLYRPVVSARFGAWYIGQQLLTFEGQAIPALAAYNGGPGNALRWAGDITPVEDIDLFVERIDYTETRGYIERIYTSYWIYRELYGGG
jgi:soluble lytic murein transglycosylase